MARSYKGVVRRFYLIGSSSISWRTKRTGGAPYDSTWSW